MQKYFHVSSHFMFPFFVDLAGSNDGGQSLCTVNKTAIAAEAFLRWFVRMQLEFPKYFWPVHPHVQMFVVFIVKANGIYFRFYFRHRGYWVCLCVQCGTQSAVAETKRNKNIPNIQGFFIELYNGSEANCVVYEFYMNLKWWDVWEMWDDDMGLLDVNSFI